jgi:dihydroorotase-like cyclic amidohydrolase
VETTTRILLDLVSRGVLTLPQVAYLRSERPAMIYGLTGQKGSLRLGFDADLILVDLKRKVRFDNAQVVSKCGWTPYHGREVTGDVVKTLVRGKVVMEAGKVTGEPGWGRFLTRKSVP